MTESDYDREFASDAFKQSIPSDLPEYLFPEEVWVREDCDDEVSDDESDDEDENVSADGEVSSDEEEEEVVEEHTHAEAGTRQTLPNGIILEANGLGGVAVVVPAPPVEAEVEAVGAEFKAWLSQESEDEMGEMVDEQAEMEAQIADNGCVESGEESETEVIDKEDE